MRFALYLREEYVMSPSTLDRKGLYTVYKNPNNSEISELRKDIIKYYNDESVSVRGLVDLSNKNLYVFPAVADIHDNVYHQLKNSKESVSSNVLNFIGYISNNKLYGENLTPLFGNSVLPKVERMLWLKNYIHNTDTLEIMDASFAEFK